MGIIAIVIAATGAAFCFVLAAGVALERSGASEAHEMLNLFEIIPVDNDAVVH